MHRDCQVELHHVLPKRSWITVRFSKERDVERAIELFRLSYYLAKKHLL
ncbi:MAG: luciferase domain-containing protein [Nitrososphaerales archaeon]